MCHLCHQNKVSPVQQRNTQLACPFWKFDPAAHQDCRDKKLRNVSDIRTHLKRVHLQPDFCVVCKAVLGPHRNSHSQAYHTNCAEGCSFKRVSSKGGLTRRYRSHACTI
ncbi:hypothetical protein B0T21DRAFT_181855 [Apiosordaria backusii]|uniref:Uncharacterized protein n=1 Tax=Apiosordaria backusii TaxID=314023 RepID=A0AA40ECP5_9PEZI|nr:hypothetical protein B0T21DRAFT_181855 [Apiosordaria backusii]